MYIEFFNDQKNLDMISCYSNEGDGWDKTKIKLENTNYEENKLLFNILERTGSIINKSKNSISVEKIHNENESPKLHKN